MKSFELFFEDFIYSFHWERKRESEKEHEQGGEGEAASSNQMQG